MLATIRIVGKNEDEDEMERAMEFEYSDKDHDEFINYLNNSKDFDDFKYIGNAFSVQINKQNAREILNKFKEMIQNKYPAEKVEIEWGYWVDD